MNYNQPEMRISPCYSCIHRVWWVNSYRCRKAYTIGDAFIFMSNCSLYESKEKEDETDTSNDGSADSGEE